MKRFSNLSEKEKLMENKLPKLDSEIANILKETLNVTLTNEKHIGKKIVVSGKAKFIEKMKAIIEENKKETVLMNESVMTRFLDEKSLNEALEKLYEAYDEMTLVPNPEDIFSAEDYEVQNDTIILKTFENIPEDFLDYVNRTMAKNYFDDGNTIRITNTDDNKWRVFFIRGSLLNHIGDDYKSFIKTNNAFIADFLFATRTLIGPQNLVIDKNLLNSVK